MNGNYLKHELQMFEKHFMLWWLSFYFLMELFWVFDKNCYLFYFDVAMSAVDWLNLKEKRTSVTEPKVPMFEGL